MDQMKQSCLKQHFEKQFKTLSSAKELLGADTTASSVTGVLSTYRINACLDIDSICIHSRIVSRWFVSFSHRLSCTLLPFVCISLLLSRQTNGLFSP